MKMPEEVSIEPEEKEAPPDVVETPAEPVPADPAPAAKPDESPPSFLFSIYVAVFLLLNLLLVIITTETLFAALREQSVFMEDIRFLAIGLLVPSIFIIPFRDMLTQLNRKTLSRAKDIFLNVLFIFHAILCFYMFMMYLGSNLAYLYEGSKLLYLSSLLWAIVFVVLLNVLAKFRLVRILYRVLLILFYLAGLFLLIVLFGYGTY